MFGFRSNTTRRKVHSNNQRPTKSTDVATRPQVEINRLRMEQSGPSFDETADDDRYYHENSSVDMSLYTTQSKSTIHYSSRALVNYGNSENESDDGFSSAQTEFTTEVALNRYFRLGGAWQPPDSLLGTPKSHAGVPASPDFEFTSPQSKDTEQTKPLTVSPWSRNSSVSDDDSLNVISPTDSDCEQTTCSLLPATSKMARLANMASPAILQQAQKRYKTPQMRNNNIAEARDHCEIENMIPNSLPNSTSKCLQPTKGPIDLDESVADSISMASSSNSCVVSFSGTAPPRIYRQPGKRLLEQAALSPPQALGSRHLGSTTRNPKDEDTYLFSSGDSTSASSSKLSLHYGTSTPPQKSIESVPVPMSISSGSWRGRSLQSPDQFSVDSLRDDDTYGFSIVSGDCEKSLVTSKSSEITPKVRLGELFEQWGDSYESTSAKWKPQGTPRQLSPSYDIPLETLYSNAIAGCSTKVEDRKSSTTSSSSRKTTAEHHSVDALRVSPQGNVTIRRPSTSSQSDDRVTGKLKSAKDPAQPNVEKFKDRISTMIMDRPQEEAIATNNNSATRAKVLFPLSYAPCPEKTFDRQVGNVTAMAGSNLYAAQQSNCSQQHRSLPSASLNDQKIAFKATPVSRLSPQGIESGNSCSGSSGSQSRAVVASDDDTFGFSTTSPAPIPELSCVETLGIRPSPLTRTGTGKGYVWTDPKVADTNDYTRWNIERETQRSTLHATTTRDQVANVSGAVLLTETALQKHLTKVQDTEPHPSTSFEGYDSWKRKQEEKERYFAMLDAKAKERKTGHHATIDRRQPGNGERSSQRVETRQQTTQHSRSCDSKCSDSHRSATSGSIPPLKDGSSTPHMRTAGRRRLWGWLPSGKKDKASNVNQNHINLHAKGKESIGKIHKITVQEIVPLSHFMRISGNEDPEVVEFSKSPLHKDGIMSLGTTTLPESANTDAATKSHYLHDNDLGTRGLLSKLIQDERKKQHLAEEEKRKSTIERDVRGQGLPKPNKNVRSLERRSIRSASPARSKQMIHDKPQRANSRDDGSVVIQTVSVSSKQSVASSMKSGSGKVLSPCAICTSAERTHVAMPCMHFYFCKECVETLNKAVHPTCPVCSTTDVVFTRVYTG